MTEELNPQRTSVAAVLAAIFTLVSAPGLVCCLPVGCGTALIAIPLAGFGVYEFHSGKANTVSGVIAWISLVASVGAILASFALVGFAGLTNELKKHDINLPVTETIEAPVPAG